MKGLAAGVLVLALLAVLGLAGGAQAASVSVDSSSSTGGQATSFTISHTTGSGSDRLLVVAVTLVDNGIDKEVSGVTYGGTSMTQAANIQGTDHRVQVFRLGNPPTGTADVVVSLEKDNKAGIGVVGYFGVDQTNPLGTPVSSSGSGTSSSVTVSSSTDDMVMDHVGTDKALTGPGAGQTQQYVVGAEPGKETGGSTEPGASSVDMSWTFNEAAKFTHVAFNIQAVPDTTPPAVSSVTTLDRDADGKVDAANVVFSEPIDDSTIQAGSWTIGGVTVEAVSTTVDGDADVDDDRVQLQINTDANEVAGTDVEDVTYTQGTTADLAGNLLANVANGDVAEADGARPTVTDLEFFDTDADGLVDRMIVSFSENIDTDDGAAPVAADFGSSITLPDGSTADLSGASFTDPGGAGSTVTITGIAGQVTANTAVGSTGIAGDLSANWEDGSGNALVTTLDDETVTDSAAPARVGIAYKDVDGNGQVDRIDITYSEPLAGTAEVGDYSLGGTEAGSVSLDSATVSGSTVQLGVTGPPGDTGLDLEVSYDRTAGTADSIRDGPGNVAASFVGEPAADEAPPVVISILTRDTDSDGNTDAADVTFSEPILDSTVTPDDWTIGGVTVEAVSTTVGGDADADDEKVRLRITTDGNEVAGTDAKDVTYTQDAPTDADVTDHSGNLLANVATGDVTEGANDAPTAGDDTATTNEDTAVTVDVLANDSDVDGDTLSVTGATDPIHGAVAVNADDTITYTPDPDYNGVDSFTYTASDGALTDDATVTVVVDAVNDAPVAADDAATTDEDTAVTVDVLADDTDVDGDTLTAASTTAPADGTVSVNGDGTITYTPDADFNGDDAFTYTVSDGSLTDTATVSVTVNPVVDAPTAVDDDVATDEDTAVTADVLANDFHGDGHPIEISKVGTPSHGSSSLNPDGTITYTPDPDFNGADSFTYTITDGSLEDTATVSVTVSAFNDAPVAHDDPTVTVQDTAVTIRVLANDADIDGDALSVASLTTPSNGSVEINGDGTVTYDPDRRFLGSDEFTYTVSDGTLTAVGRVPIDVVQQNDPPVARDDDAATDEDTPVTIDVLANDDDPNGNTLRVVSVTAPANGSASIDGRSKVVYTPDPDIHGSDSFRYTVTDGALSDSARVTVSISSVNDEPSPGDDDVETDEDENVTIDVLANDEDVDGDVLTITGVDAPEDGAVNLNDDETVTYAPDPDFNGADTFSYSVTDEDLTATGRVRVTVHPVNDPPEARDDGVRTPEATPVDVRVLANDVDVDGDALEVVSVTDPASGEAVIVRGDLVRYSPPVGFLGNDSFTYTVTDGRLDDTATVRVQVGPTPDTGIPPGIEGFDASGATVLRLRGSSPELAWPRVPTAEGYQVWRWNDTVPPSPPNGTARVQATTNTSQTWVHVATLSPDARAFAVPRPDPGQPPAWYKVTWFPTFGGDAHVRPGEDPTRLDGWNSTAAIQVDPAGDGVDERPPASGLDWSLWWLVALATATVTVGAYAASRRR